MQYFKQKKCPLFSSLVLLSSLVASSAAFADRTLQISDQQINALLNAPMASQQQGAKKPYQIKRIKQRVTQNARRMLRVPYRWGGTSPKGFDCSGLVQYTYKHAGINLPRTAAQQYKATRKISPRHAAKGDLIFFHTPRRGNYVNHVGIYMGDNTFIHAPGRGKFVKVSRLNRYWNKKIVGVGRTQ